jgi:hypothetical protein
MSEVLNGEAAEPRYFALHDAPKLLIEWPSPWHEFRTAIRPALAKSTDPLAGEAPVGMFPYRGMLATWLLQLLILIAIIYVPLKLARLRPYTPPATPKWDVIYYSGDELPQTEDNGGARAGRSGRAGGHEARHRTQTIRVARGESLREKIVDAPRLNLPRSDSAVANLLAFRPVPGPAPMEGLRSTLRTPSLNAAIVPPSPDVQHDKLRSAPTLNANVVPPPPEVPREKMRSQSAMNPAVVPPSPSAPQRDLAAVHLPGSQAVAVVAPPVSAPEQITNMHPKLTLPVSVVAPPPTEITHDLKSFGQGFGSGDLQKQIVPPPVQISGTSTNPHAASGFGNASDSVVPPPVQLKGAASGARAISGSAQTDKVVPPPVQISGASAGSSPKSSRQIAGLAGSGSAVPPAPVVSGRSVPAKQIARLGGSGNVVPPAPSVTGDPSVSGLGHGSRDSGLGGSLDAGSVSAPPSNSGGNAPGSGLVVSSQPGTKVGLPSSGGPGALALSPAGGEKPGLGGSGGGAGIGKGSGPGSGLNGEGTGTTKTGTGRGSDVAASSGISPYPGPGGAGNGSVSKPPVPGVSVHGGSSNIITLPSFGADGNPSSMGGHSLPPKKNEGPAITIVGSPRSGGALNLYGKLKGDKVYTIYIDTSLGTVVLEYADPTSAAHPYGEDLIAPQPMRADLPANLKPSRLLIACVLDRSGMIKDPHVLEAATSDLSAKVLASLPSWKFRPVFRGQQPIEVNAILGFAIDTR